MLLTINQRYAITDSLLQYIQDLLFRTQNLASPGIPMLHVYVPAYPRAVV